MYPVLFSEKAQSDLDSILDYIINKLFNRAAAKRLYEDIERAITYISNTPEMFPLSGNKRLDMYNVRKANVRGYNMYYLFDGSSVFVIRFMSTLSNQSSNMFVKSIIEIFTRP